jgi:prolyl-tRNA editing enzyme YbaK/EbsC (Cys-tRNA(Pro) deacylase)
MPLLERLRDFLQAQQTVYTHSVHRTAYTAREVASAKHLPPAEVAKTGTPC